MDVKRISAIILFTLFLVLTVSSAHSVDLDNSTYLSDQYQHDDFISEDGSVAGNVVPDDYCFEIAQWGLDESGNIVKISSRNYTIENLKTDNVSRENVTDLRNNNNGGIPTNFSDIIVLFNNGSSVSSPLSMIVLNKDLNNLWNRSNQYILIPGNITIDWEEYINNPCNVFYSKKFNESINVIDENKDKPYVIESNDSSMFYSKNNVYKVRILNLAGCSVGEGINVTFIFKGKKINAKTDDEGYARLKIDSQPGLYAVKVYSGQINAAGKIIIKPLFKTKNVNVKYKKSSKFTIKLIKQNGKSVSKKTVNVKFKGKDYKVKTNSNGIATFNIPKNLKMKKYAITVNYMGCVVTNKITVKK